MGALSGKVVLVTGGGNGIGRDCALIAAQEGAKVVIADLQADKGQALAAELGGVFVRCDVSQEADGQAAVAAAVALGPLFGLVNCAGIAPAVKTVGKDGAHPLASYTKTIMVNLVGSFNMIRLAAEAMSKNEADAGGERGVIVSTASVAAFDGQLGQAGYAASKGGVVAMTLPIARELCRSGIRVMTIAPGIMETPMLLGMPADVQDALGKMVPFPSRMGKPAEFAALVEHIFSNGYLNGEVIRLDGAIRMAAK